MIEATGLTKRFGSTLAVDNLSFRIPSGQVTGFLGPNGSGKSTTMRMILGLDAPTSGSVTVNGRPYKELRRPLREVGALLEARATHPGRSAVDHLHYLALSNRIPRSRVAEVLELAGLSGVGHKRAGTFSLGMGQRLGIAAALLGDPSTIILDEPVNGLDPDGVLWVRNLVKELAAEGRTVFLSSHLMSEMALTADRLLVIGRGRLLAHTTMADLLAGGGYVVARSPGAVELADALRGRGATVHMGDADTIQVYDTSTDLVGEVARSRGIVLRELSTRQTTLEKRYMELTGQAVDYNSVDLTRLASESVN